MKKQQSNLAMTDSLNYRFQDLCRRCLNPNSSFKANFVAHDILRRYRMAGRRYHNLSHLIHCLRQFDMVSQLIPHPDAVEMALWFHDAVYTPGSPDNEQKSAELFLRKTHACFPRPFKTKVKRLIMATTHKDVPRDKDECFIADIDLSSFGSDWGDFLVDTRNLRRERMDVPDPAYFQAHTQFLNHLLARKRIFHTDFFYQRYEQIALQNITRLLAKRKAQGYS